MAHVQTPEEFDARLSTEEHAAKAERRAAALPDSNSGSSIAHSLIVLTRQVAELTEAIRADGAQQTGIVSDGVTAIQQHLPLAATDRHRALALQEQGVAAIRDLTEVIRAVGAERSATPRQPGSVPAPEGRYLHGRCGCAEGRGRCQWDGAAWTVYGSLLEDVPHCQDCGARLLTPDECAAIGQPAGTAVAFAPLSVSDEGVRAALARANAKLAKANCLRQDVAFRMRLHEIYGRDDTLASALASVRELYVADLREEAATDE